MEEFNDYSFRAITSKKQVYIGTFLWCILYGFFYFLVNIIFDKEQATLFNNAKIFLISFLLSSLFSLFIFQYILTSKISIELVDEKIIIRAKNKKESIDLKDLKEVNFTQHNKFNKIVVFVFLTNKKEINIITGFIFTLEKESLKAMNAYINYIKKYLLINSFIEVGIPKINGLKEKLIPKS